MSQIQLEDTDLDPRIARAFDAFTDQNVDAMLEEFAEPYQDLLERQLRLILKRLSATGPR